MVLFLKWASRTVHHYPEQREQEKKLQGSEELTSTVSLTVWTKSLVFNCSGFTVIGSDGNLAFRVDNYIGRPDEIVLMDGSGLPIFTLCRRKKLMRLVDKCWFVYEGEAGKYNTTNSSKKPVYCVRKNKSYGQRKSNVVAYVCCGKSDKRYVYTIEGSYRHRSCKILDESRRVVGEIKKKESKTGVTFGLEVFHLVVNPGFDSSFSMAIVLLLDQMFT